MVYVNSRGDVEQGSRIHWTRPITSFLAFFQLLIAFFSSLFSPFNPSSKFYSSNSLRGNGGGSSGGSGGSNGYGHRGNGGARPRGGFMTTSDIRPPPMPGCSSCG